MEILLKLLLVILFVFLNGFFVAAEFALVAVRKTRIEELARKGNKTAKLVQHSLKDIGSVISAAQVGITLASLALGWIGEPAIAAFLEPRLEFLPQRLEVISSHAIAFIVAFTIITYLHLVFGEFVPKAIAMQKSENTILLTITPVVVFAKIFLPFVWIINQSGAVILRLFGVRAPEGHQLVHSEEEIKMILSHSAEGGAIEPDEAEMAHKIFKMADNPVSKIMVPRDKVIAFAGSLSLKEAEKIARISTYSRYPTYKRSLDSITGFIHIKDIYGKLMRARTDTTISRSRIARKIIFVPETETVDDVLKIMRKKRVHIAAVRDKHKKITGVVTLTDVIESLVGDIEDEFEVRHHEVGSTLGVRHHEVARTLGVPAKPGRRS